MLPDQQLAEHPDDTIRRLKATGEWPNADKVLRKVKAVHRRRYVKVGAPMNDDQRLEMTKAAWDEVHAQWPPPPNGEPLASLRDYLGGGRGLDDAAKLKLPALSAAAEARFTSLGKADDPTADISWVFNHLEAPKLNPMTCPSRGA